MKVQQVKPIQDEETAKILTALMRSIDEFFNPPGKPREMGITIMVFPFAQDGRMNYMSNANREDMICSLKETIAVLEGRKLDTQTHQ